MLKLRFTNEDLSRIYRRETHAGVLGHEREEYFRAEEAAAGYDDHGREVSRARIGWGRRRFAELQRKAEERIAQELERVTAAHPGIDALVDALADLIAEQVMRGRTPPKRGR